MAEGNHIRACRRESGAVASTGMGPIRRWSVVAATAVLLVGAPVALRWLPPGPADASPATTLDRARDAVAGSWSGSVELDGTLQLPDADEIGGLAGLLG